MAWDELDAGYERGGVLRLLGPLAPQAVRRGARVERVADEINRAAARGGVLPDGGFDPSRGASGRPSALYEHPGGARTAPRTAVTLNQAEHWGQKLIWSGIGLCVEEARRHGRVFTVPLAPRTGTRGRGGTAGVAEAALFFYAWSGRDAKRPNVNPADAYSIRGSLHFLDAHGYAVLVVPEVQRPWREIAGVIAAAGVPFRLYGFSCPRRAAEEIADLLFPRRRSCQRVKY